MPNYQQGYEEGRNEHRYSAHSTRVVGRGLGALIGWGFVLGSRVVVQALVAAPFITLGFIILAPMDFLGPVFGIPRLMGMGLVAFLAYAGLYWLKGLVVALRHRRGGLWVLPFLVCVTLACLLPGYLAHLVVAHSLPAASPVWGWAVGAALALFAYCRYRFTENSAPKLVEGFYRRGYQWGAAR
ncbi:hypothetical protein [Hymenobacter glacieicola]|uniref:Uncharacterized protein n=1 Tax=Hymenobacter glacieicola TaxID=1562124 RepID=A0ABQ1X4J8_9BACT|nr:hypothetical protein [Hymenobacter glacieicola]GGG59665.1 hypothetical protein GCM10011378_39580 [Hymenobacter glacieicola]